MKQFPNEWLFGVFLLLLLLFFHLHISPWEITPVLWGLRRKKALEAVTSFKMSFVHRASNARALYVEWQARSPARHARGCLTQHESHTWQSEGKKGKEKLYSNLPVTSSYPHDHDLLEKYFYLFLKVTSQNNLRNKTGCEENAALDCQCHWKMNVWIKTPRYHHIYPAQQPTHWEEANAA